MARKGRLRVRLATGSTALPSPEAAFGGLVRSRVAVPRRSTAIALMRAVRAHAQADERALRDAVARKVDLAVRRLGSAHRERLEGHMLYTRVKMHFAAKATLTRVVGKTPRPPHQE